MTNEHPPDHVVAEAIRYGNASPCAKSQRGVVIYLGSRSTARIISGGYNAPQGTPCDGSTACRRDCGRICVHAEQRAIINALQKPERVGDTTMLHVKVVDGLLVAGKGPCCDACSKLILASGIADMWLYEMSRGWVRYTAEEFHRETLRACGLHGGR